MVRQKKLAAGTGSSVVVDRCQVCDSPDLDPVLFIGYLPPVNTMPPIGTRPAEQPAYPAELLYCRRCGLVQLGLIVDPGILFPPSYPYTSGTTRILRENFAELAREVGERFPLRSEDLLVDVGSNDGTLLGNFVGTCRVHGIEPTNAGKLAMEKGISTDLSFFNRESVRRTIAAHGRARMISATNVFAHIEDIHEIVDCVLELLEEDGIFVTESHDISGLIETLQYDTIYHEHLRYYSVTALAFLFEMHGMEILHARTIPTHGGSIRVYAARRGRHQPHGSVAEMIAAEAKVITAENFVTFRKRVVNSKLALYALLKDIKGKDQRIYGVGAPSRSSTLINYVGLDAGIIDCVLEIRGSYKIGKYVPGTMIPVVDEARLFEDQPEFAMLFSWHIADELVPKLRGRGFQGRFIIPLPEPRIV